MLGLGSQSNVAGFPGGDACQAEEPPQGVTMSGGEKLCAAVAAVFFIAGCAAPPPAPVPAPRPAINPAEIEKIEKESAEAEAAAPLLQKEIAARLLVPETKESMSKQGAEPVASTPDQFAAFIRSEMAKWSAVIKVAGLEASQ